MAGKFTRSLASTGLPTGPIQTVGPVGSATTHEGAAAYGYDTKSELFTLAAVNMVGEDTFYERSGERDDRFRALIKQATIEDPDWVARFIPYLRKEMNMRSASVVMAVESALARREVKLASERATIPVREMIADALQRADEPAELIAYWRHRTHKRAVPGGVQRGVGDAVVRLFTERAALKYDGVHNQYRMMDVIALAKPEPVTQAQTDLYNFLADRRYNRPEIRVTENLPIISAYMAAKAMPEAERREYFLADPKRLKNAGMTWEELSSLGPMDKRAWEAMIPSMGIMALARNLRNFDEAGVSDEAAQLVINRLSDPDEVARSRMFPYRWLSAYLAAPSQRWGYALDKALTASTAAVPLLPGRTLVLVDTSASMGGTVSAKSKVTYAEIGALIGMALARRGAEVDLIGFANGTFEHKITKGGSMLRDIQAFTRRIGEVGHGTKITESVRTCYNGHDRVIIVSDMQTFGYYGQGASELVPAKIPVFGLNVAGYGNTQIDTSKPNRFEIAGFSDKVFTMFDLLARGAGADWPF